MTALSERLRTGVHPGLPEPMTRVPFGRDCPYGEAFGITQALVQIVVALIAGELTGFGPATITDAGRLTDFHVHNCSCAKLERGGWIVCVGRTSTKAKLWQATPRAKRLLGFEGWTFWHGPATEEQERAA